MFEDTDHQLSQFANFHLKHSPFYSICLGVVYTAIFVSGFVGNFMVITVIVLKPHMRTITNLFLLNLAIADSLVLLFCLPATLLASVYNPWILGSFMCKGVTFVQGISVISSAYFIAAISVDRCTGLCQDSASTHGFDRNQAILVALVIWLFSLLLHLPWLFVFQIQLSSQDGHEYCVEIWNDQNLDIFYFVFVTLFCSYILPAVVISVANAIIWRKISGNNLPQQNVNSSESVAKMLGLVTLTYLFSWLPLYSLATILKLSPSEFDSEEEWLFETLVPIAQCLGYWNSCVNPVLYGFYNSQFRKMFKSLLPEWIRTRVFKNESIAAGEMRLENVEFTYDFSQHGDNVNEDLPRDNSKLSENKEEI